MILIDNYVPYMTKGHKVKVVDIPDDLVGESQSPKPFRIRFRLPRITPSKSGSGY